VTAEDGSVDCAREGPAMTVKAATETVVRKLAFIVFSSVGFIRRTAPKPSRRTMLQLRASCPWISRMVNKPAPPALSGGVPSRVAEGDPFWGDGAATIC
jgi:hypothetical protein